MSNKVDRDVRPTGLKREPHAVEWRFDDPAARHAETTAYQAQLADFRRRGRYAFLVRVSTTVLAILLLAIGVALTLGSMTSMPGSFLAQRYVPGADGSITILRDGNYALTNEAKTLPVCSITDLDGVDIPQRPISLPGNPPMEASLFHVSEGGYRVFCEGGNDGVTAFAHESLDIVQNRLLGLALQALPFLVVGLVSYFAGTYAAARIHPESSRPVVPS
ncbi:MAG: hypothetical protein IPJ61_07055 [Tessaracoccus sp.]|uniref:hypothetical protein n=1 Tax=Tessaracoccus sp. TaxID=1971211 RepID=UPI001EB84081|nr:hypothetical protein [Tessaracoccus sp.]MBK7820831.1 hypothetical protein [Tessaracoccus sp.]